MPKRIGYLYEKVIDKNNCREAIFTGTKNLDKTKEVLYIRAHADEYAEKISNIIQNGWMPEPLRNKTITEGNSRKVRHLQIPSLRDHLIHVAIMLPIMDKLTRYFDPFCCGSIEGRGQGLVNKYLKRVLEENHPKYGADADVYHCYPTIKHNDVIASLRRIIKDEKYIHLHETILHQMNPSGVGLAIGFQPSHWYANLVLTDVDRVVRNSPYSVTYVRYMDNINMTSNRKRHLHKALNIIVEELAKKDMRLNNSHQIYHIKDRGIQLLSYRYFPKKVILKKITMYAITAAIKRFNDHPCVEFARGMLSRLGLLEHCDSENYKRKYIYGKTDINKARRMVSYDDRKRALCRATELGDYQPGW